MNFMNVNERKKNFQEAFERSCRFLMVQDRSTREHVNVQGSTFLIHLFTEFLN